MAAVTKTEESSVYDYKYRAHVALPWKTKQWSQTIFTGSMASTNHEPLNTEVDDGGPWLMSKTQVKLVPGILKHDRYEGPFTVSGYRYGYTTTEPQTSDTDAQMIAFGSTAIANCAPNDPLVDMATAIGEVRNEGLPSPVGVNLWKSKTRAAHGAGSEYLNYEFGWRPLISELRSFAASVNDSTNLWNNFKKGSEKKTRAGYSGEPDYVSGSITGEMIPFPSYVPGFLQGGLTESVRTQRWFKGCFKYYVPEPSAGFASRMSYYAQQARYLYGLELSPATVWNLQPWSWATDWVIDTGSLMSNISNFGSDGLVLQYGYAMHESTALRHYYGSFGGIATSRSLEIKRAKRIQATPYGFGVLLSSLSARQIAIIAALGLARS